MDTFEMRRFSEAGPGEMEWTQPEALSRAFELRRGSSLLATLAWRSAFGSMATATTADGVWTFKRVGFWSARVTIRRQGSETDEAVFRPTGWGRGSGELHWADGAQLRLDREGFWSSTWKWREASPSWEPPGPALVELGDVGGLFRWRATVRISADAASDPRTPVLACLIWYLAVLAYLDQAAAGGAAAAVAAG